MTTATAPTTTAPPATTRPNRVGWTTTALLLTLVLAMLDMNIVNNATPTIIRDLGAADAIDLIPWLFTTYMLASTVTQPLFGKLCDQYGPKIIYMFTVGTFMLGSALCGLAQNLGQLIAFRTVQGLGGGGLMSVSMVIIPMVAVPKTRALLINLAVMIGAVGIVLGPLVGGVLAEHLSWRWVFYINLPLGLLAIGILAVTLHLPVKRRVHRIDLLGAALIAAGASAIMLATQWGGRKYAWDSSMILGLAAAAVVLLALFIWRQLRATEPIFTLSLFRVPAFRIISPVQFLGGLAGIGALAYITIVLQYARGLTPTKAGLYMIPMAVGLIISATVAARILRRYNRSKWLLVTGSALSALAMLLLGQLSTDTPYVVIGADLLLLGLGVGLGMGTGMYSVQISVPRENLGVATMSIRFGQTLGAALGTAIFGAIVTKVFAANLPADLKGKVGDPGSATLSTLAPSQRHAVLHAFITGADAVFLTSSAIAVVTVLILLLLRERRPQPEPAAG